jgi:hypothetical protein
MEKSVLQLGGWFAGWIDMNIVKEDILGVFDCTIKLENI